MCRVFNVQIVVVSTVGNGTAQFFGPAFSEHLIKTLPVLWLGHYGESNGAHYVSLCQKSFEDAEHLLKESKKHSCMPWKVDQIVNARWRNNRFYPAKIVSLNIDNTINVIFEDGEKWTVNSSMSKSFTFALEHSQ